MNQSIRITVNGSEMVLDPPCTVSGLCERLGLSEASVLIEHNGVALLKEEKTAVILHEKDRLEILRIAAGG